MWKNWAVLRVNADFRTLPSGRFRWLADGPLGGQLSASPASRRKQGVPDTGHRRAYFATLKISYVIENYLESIGSMEDPTKLEAGVGLPSQSASLRAARMLAAISRSGVRDLPLFSRQPLLFWVTRLGQHLAQPCNTEEFLQPLVQIDKLQV